MLGASDAEHLALAHSEGRVIVTQDTDFLKLAEQGHPHGGIVYAARHTTIGSIIRGLLLIHNVLSADEMAGNIEFL